MDPILLVVLTTAVALLLATSLSVLLLARSRKTWALEKGRALLVSTPNGTRVSFQGALVLPLLHRAELMDITTRVLEIERSGRQGLICRDNIRADICARFYVRVNQTIEDVLRVATAIGCARASDPAVLRELFEAKFSEALKTVARTLDFEELVSRRQEFRDGVIGVIGADLSGFVLDDLVIDELEQTPIEHLDPNNILDAEGIRKITQRTVEQQLAATELKLALELVRARRASNP